MYKLSIFSDRLLDFLTKLVNAPLSMWNGAAGDAGNRLMLMVFFVAFAGGALYLLVAFLKAAWKDKLRMLGTAFIIVFVLLVILWFALM